MTRICVAFKAHLGWVNTVAVRLRATSPEPVLGVRVELIEAADREAREPYHVAAGWSGLQQGPKPPEPELVVRRGRARQATAARGSLSAFRQTLLRQGLDWRQAVMLTGRGRLGDLDHILATHARIHVAEGEAIRDATRDALRDLGIVCVDQDEKSILADAQRLLHDEDADHLMKSRRPASAAAWGREERLLALGAWLRCR